MTECTCGNPDIEYTVVKDELSKYILIQAICNNCGRMASGYGRTVEQALLEVRRDWKKCIRRQRR